MDLEKPPDCSDGLERVEESQEEVREVVVPKGSLEQGGEKQIGLSGSKGSWVEAAQEKKVLRKYELDVTDLEGQKSVEIPDEVLIDANPLWEDYLIEKFLDTAPHVARVHAVVNKIWSYGDKKQVIDVQVVDETTMKFRVASSIVRARILRRGMWNIGNIPLVITKWTPEELKEKPEVKSIPLWVHLKNVPVHMFSWKGLSFIASAAGSPVRLHPETASCSNFKLAKVFVNADLTKELPQKINFTKNGKSFTVEFIYPWLPLRCAICGKWGHIEKVCVMKKQGRNEQSVQEMAKELAKVAVENSGNGKEGSKERVEEAPEPEESNAEVVLITNLEEIEEGEVVEEWPRVSNGKGSRKKTQELKYGQVKIASRYSLLSDLEDQERMGESKEVEDSEDVEENRRKAESVTEDEDLGQKEELEGNINLEANKTVELENNGKVGDEENLEVMGKEKEKNENLDERTREGDEDDTITEEVSKEVVESKGGERKLEKGESTHQRASIPRNSKTNHKVISVINSVDSGKNTPGNLGRRKKKKSSQ